MAASRIGWPDAATRPMLEARGLSKRFGALQVVRDVSLALVPGERRVVLGPNGAGKTTLFNLLAGELRPDAGNILLDGADITRLPVHARARAGLVRSYQKNNLLPGLTVGENLSLAAATAQGRDAGLFSDSFRHPEVREIVAEVAARVALTELLHVAVESLAYGSRRQLEVALALATRPRVLMMDEPTSGVGPEMVGAFHALLHALPRELTVLIIEHDMDLAFDIADRVTVLDHGERVFEGPPEEARASPLLREIYLGGWADV
jgi:ABC-type branched-subunit amino acid transport system ATPase component